MKKVGFSPISMKSAGEILFQLLGKNYKNVRNGILSIGDFIVFLLWAGYALCVKKRQSREYRRETI